MKNKRIYLQILKKCISFKYFLIKILKKVIVFNSKSSNLVNINKNIFLDRLGCCYENLYYSYT